jgi:hypothetical protein
MSNPLKPVFLLIPAGARVLDVCVHDGVLAGVCVLLRAGDLMCVFVCRQGPVFWMFAFVTACSLVFVFFYVPET